jgi:hypothetical protein
MTLELISQFRIKVSQWFEKSLGALWALQSTKNELKKLKEPFAVSKLKPKKAKERSRAADARVDNRSFYAAGRRDGKNKKIIFKKEKSENHK